jgi:hypothetical protein
MPGYTTREEQNAFNALPQDERDVLMAHAWDTAHSMERTMNGPKTIELAGHQVIAMPDELRPLSTEKQEALKKQWWLIDPTFAEVQAAEQTLWATNVKSYYNKKWTELSVAIDSNKLTGYPLFQRITKNLFARHFPEYMNLTEQEATKAGIYPNIGYPSYGARAELRKMTNAHVATLDKNSQWELRDIYEAAKKIALEKNPNATQENILAEMGTALLGWVRANDGQVCVLGELAGLGSVALDEGGGVPSLNAHRGSQDANYYWYSPRTAISSVGVMDKKRS